MVAKQVSDEDAVLAGNYYDKYHSRNPIAHILTSGFVRSFQGVVQQSGAKEVHEIGCGEGYLARHMANAGLRVRGSDVSSQIIDVAKQGSLADSTLEFQVKNIYDLREEEDSAELIVCCEVLEHLNHPEEALKILSRLASPYLIVSVPREPLWRILNMIRGKYLRDFGNTPGHLNHWSKNDFLQLLARHFDIIAMRTPLPWTMVLCRTIRQ